MEDRDQKPIGLTLLPLRPPPPRPALSQAVRGLLLRGRSRHPGERVAGAAAAVGTEGRELGS